MPDNIFGSNARLFLIENGAGPSRTAQYMERARAGAVDWGQGSLTAVRRPSPNRYGQFENVAIQRGAPDLPSLNLEAQMVESRSDWLRIARNGCEFDLQVHYGTCQDPRDFNGGWTFIRAMEGARLSSYATNDLMSFDEDQDELVIESLPVNGEEFYDIAQIRPAEQAGNEATDQIVGIVVADSVTCGACGAPSDGASVVVAVTQGTTGSPGLPTEVIYTKDGGATWSQTSINSMALADTATAIALIGSYIVVTTNNGAALHYATLASILDGTAVWASMTTGLDASGPPNAITTASPSNSWIAGDAGRIYWTADPTASVTEQADGSQTAQNLNAIHALDEDNVVAVGASNAVLVTANGGSTWSLVTGPAAGIALNAIWMRSKSEWLVGAANGNLYYTTDAGTTWTAKAFPGSGGGQVRDIKFATKLVGYMAHDIAGPAGRVLRTIDGGGTWYVAPEESGVSIPANDQITALAVAGYAEPNVVWGGGLADDGSDGIVIKFA